MSISSAKLIAGWRLATRINNDLIQRKQRLVEEGIIRSELSGINLLKAENEMYELLIESVLDKVGP